MTKLVYCTWLKGRWRPCLLAVMVALTSFSGYSQKFSDCGSSCFKSEVTSLETLEGGCLRYEMIITYDGKCEAALSHYTLEMGCGVLSSASNSVGWPMEVNQTDPTSGLTGLKVDDIREFGDENPLESFTLSFTFCPTGCEEGKDCFNPLVAYKAGQCIYKESVDAQCIKPLDVQPSAINLQCAGVSEGAVTLQISGGEAPYQVNWQHGATGTELSNLTDGTYTYTVTSADGQSLGGDVTVGSPEPVSLQASLVQSACSENAVGAISLSAAGGTPPYTFSWSDGSTEAHRNGLAAGLYTVTVSDQAGCTISETFELAGQSKVEVNAHVTQPACGVPQGSISLSSSGGTGPYTYVWSDGSTESERTGLDPGTYTVAVSDAQGCATEKSYEVLASDQVSVSANLTHPTCQQQNGSIEVVVLGGSAPYTYDWSHGGSGAALTNLTAGSYTVTVTDASGCSNSAAFSLVSQNTLFLNARTTNTNCQNEPIGALNLMVSGGTAPYTYQWDNGETSEDISGLTEGTYTVTVTDAMGCTATLIKRIQRNMFYVFGNTTNKVCDTPGFIDLQVYYAVEPIQYVWSNGATTEDIGNVSAGEYSVTVTDGSGCEVSRTFHILESDNLSLQFNATTQGCGDQITYELEGVAVGGTAPFEYRWSTGATSSILADIQPGTYELTIADANGCSRTSSYTLAPQAGVADCLIQADVTGFECGTGGNTLYTNLADARSYQWSVSSTDGLWAINHGAATNQISFTAGGENSTATFSVELVTAEGCVANCSYVVNSCTAPTEDGSDGDDSTDDDSTDESGDDSGDDGASGDGSTDDSEDGTDGDASVGEDNSNGSGDGSTDDGATDDGAGDGTSEDGNTGSEDSDGDGSGGDGNDDGSGDGTDGNDSGDGSEGDGTDEEDSGNGSEDDGNSDGSGDDNSGEDSTDNSGDGSTDDGTGGGNDGSCTDCFDARVVESLIENDVYHYTIKITSDLSCNFDLSNLVIEIPACAVLESYSNSMNWKMVEVNTDRNTGLTGIKVDDIPSFGKDASRTEFSVSLSLRATDQPCEEVLNCWSPQVAFKAGQCVTPEAVSERCVQESIHLTAYPNPASESLSIRVGSLAQDEVYTFEMYDTQGSPIKKISGLEARDLETLSVSLEQVNASFVYLKILGSKGSSWTSKIMIGQ